MSQASRSSQDLAAFLRDVPLFAGVSAAIGLQVCFWNCQRLKRSKRSKRFRRFPESKLNLYSLSRMAQASRVLRLSKGKLLFQQGDAAEAVFVVLSGGIALVLSQPDGRELVINEMRPSDCFGEMAAVTDQAR